MDSATAEVDAWARAMCQAPTAEPADIAAALGLDVSRARRVGVQLVCPAPAETSLFELVLDLAAHSVTFVRFTLTEGTPLEHFSARFGAGRAAPRGPHQSSDTVIFQRVWPAGAPRSCAVLARLRPGAEELVTSVTLYLHPAPDAGRPDAGRPDAAGPDAA